MPLCFRESVRPEAWAQSESLFPMLQQAQREQQPDLGSQCMPSLPHATPRRGQVLGDHGRRASQLWSPLEAAAGIYYLPSDTGAPPTGGGCLFP